MNFSIDKPHAFFDVDETLVIWNYSEHDLEKTIVVGGPDFEQRVLSHFKHIEALKQHKARNHITIVWSAGGAEWATAVVKKLELEKYVNFVISKPNFVYDDLNCCDFIPESQWLK